MAVDLVTDLREFLVPKVGMTVRDRRTGKYGSVQFFQWRGGLTTEIPVKYEDGTSENVPVNAFGRRLEQIDPGSDEYTSHVRSRDVEAELNLKREKLKKVASMINTLQNNRREIHAPVLRQALDQQIYDLQDYHKELLRDIQSLKQSNG